MAGTCAKVPQNKVNGHKVYEMVIKETDSKGFQNVPKLGVWSEYKQSGNPEHCFSLANDW
jgi:hypothetical protein